VQELEKSLAAAKQLQLEPQQVEPDLTFIRAVEVAGVIEVKTTNLDVLIHKSGETTWPTTNNKPNEAE
jgi:hypothetical protein